ncbi:MAG: hypothetical protein LUG45_05375 [Clostridiales bacterium]|nr:hypothetical protein [Clostridiales bacterium]
MKKGTEVWPDYDKQGNWFLHLRKERGKFTWQEIRDALTEYEEDYYLLAADCIDHGEPQFAEEEQGDHLIAYRMRDFMQ